MEEREAVYQFARISEKGNAFFLRQIASNRRLEILSVALNLAPTNCQFFLFGPTAIAMNESNSKKETDQPSSEHVSTDPSWIESNVNLVIYGLVGACVLTIVAQLALGLGFTEEHPAHFPEEEWVGFSAAFGFVAFVAVVFIGRGLRLIVKRDEGYYDA